MGRNGRDTCGTGGGSCGITHVIRHLSRNIAIAMSSDTTIGLAALLKAANEEYGYSEEDKAILRKLAETDKEGLRTALLADPLVMWRIEYGSAL